MRVPVSVRHIAALTIALVLAASAPLAAQEEKKPERPRKEVRRPASSTSRSSIRTTTQRPTHRLKPTPRTRSKPTPRFRAPERKADVDRERRTIDRRILNRGRTGFETFRRPRSTSHDARSVSGGAGAAAPDWTVDEVLSRPDAPGHVMLLDGGESPAERARIIAEIQQMLRLQTDGAEAEEDDDRVRPPEGNPASPQLPNRTFGDSVFEPRPPETPAEEPPPVYAPPVYVTPSSPWFDTYDATFFDCAYGFGSPFYLSGAALLDSWRYGWIDRRFQRRLWHYGGTPLFGQGESYRCFGLEYAPQWDWNAYTGRLDAENDDIVDCARVTVQRFDGAAASFVVPMPALDAETLDELHEAIAERLARGETIELAVTLRPEDIESFSVEPCDEEDSL